VADGTTGITLASTRDSPEWNTFWKNDKIPWLPIANFPLVDGGWNNLAGPFHTWGAVKAVYDDTNLYIYTIIHDHLKSSPGRLRLALTGGVASGKTVVAGLFERLGARHIDFDLLARRAAAPGEPGFEAALALLGPDFLRPDGALDRPKVGRAVFADQALRAELEKIFHPLIWDLMARELEPLAAEPLVLISVPLLFEAGLETFFRPIVLVFAEPATQLKRLLARSPGLTRAEAEALAASQWPAPPKVMGSHFIINNNGDLAGTEAQVGQVLAKIKAAPAF
jgi:dephospho-CoA kinase